MVQTHQVRNQPRVQALPQHDFVMQSCSKLCGDLPKHDTLIPTCKGGLRRIEHEGAASPSFHQSGSLPRKCSSWSRKDPIAQHPLETSACDLRRCSHAKIRISARQAATPMRLLSNHCVPKAAPEGCTRHQQHQTVAGNHAPGWSVLRNSQGCCSSHLRPSLHLWRPTSARHSLCAPAGHSLPPAQNFAE